VIGIDGRAAIRARHREPRALERTIVGAHYANRARRRDARRVGESFDDSLGRVQAGRTGAVRSGQSTNIEAVRWPRRNQRPHGNGCGRARYQIS
jgi:hypothetical protein